MLFLEDNQQPLHYAVRLLMILKRIKIIIVFLIPFLFSGCSFLTEFYIQNFTNEPKIIQVKFNEKRFIMDTLDYTSRIVQPKKFWKIKNDSLQQIVGIEKESQLVEYVIKPNSTTRVVRSINYMWKTYFIDYIIIDSVKYTVDKIVEDSEKIKTHYVYKME
ncbi:hypothetical protein EAX61_05265 [Dokdonia sinensis]|uniref:Uncharacterized protein n=1 Tax=Dokdonia sinensis TaxID=2479847 RepID=A0A3M0G7K1_9FLAO|nr:hypothetical protein EAX61_05265 [Dokdonia sinensis]